MSEYPSAMPASNHVEPCPRRLRATLAGETVFDTADALYVWEHSHYPQYYVPLADVRSELLVNEANTVATHRGSAELHAVRVGDTHRPRAAKVLSDSPIERLRGTVRFEWTALDAWFEEDEQVHVHARSPYVRVDALRSSRHVRIELDGVVLAESSSPVLVFETGLPTRYYLDPPAVDLRHLVASETVTACPYKGVTSGYWSADVGGATHADVAWSYAFPTRQLSPIAGLIAFFNERVDMLVDGQLLARPQTPYSSSGS